MSYLNRLTLLLMTVAIWYCFQFHLVWGLPFGCIWYCCNVFIQRLQTCLSSSRF